MASPQLSRDFVKIEFEHVPKEANFVIHEIARMSRGPDHGVWFDNLPVSIIPLILDDVTS